MTQLVPTLLLLQPLRRQSWGVGEGGDGGHNLILWVEGCDEGRVLREGASGGRGEECCLGRWEALLSGEHLDRTGRGRWGCFPGSGNGESQGLDAWKTVAC